MRVNDDKMILTNYLNSGLPVITYKCGRNGLIKLPKVLSMNELWCAHLGKIFISLYPNVGEWTFIKWHRHYLFKHVLQVFIGIKSLDDLLLNTYWLLV